MLHEFPTPTDVDAKRAQHALVLTEIRLAILFIFDINIERFAFEEYLEVGIVLQYWVCGSLIEHPLQRRPSRLYKIRIESADGLLLRRRGNNNTGVIAVQ